MPKIYLNGYLEWETVKAFRQAIEQIAHTRKNQAKIVEFKICCINNSTYKASIVRKVLRRFGPKFLETYSFRNKIQRNVEELKNFDEMI